MKRLPFANAADVRASLAGIVAHLRTGGLVAYPTETVYGFGGLIRDDALTQLSALKARDESKPFLLLIHDKHDIATLDWTPSARKLAAHFWPGALTLALRVREALPSRILSAEGTVAVRSTPHEGVRMLLEALDEPITSTSANLPRESPAASADDVVRILATLEREDVLVLDGGTLAPSQPSTLIDCSVDPPRLLRAGAITREAIAQVVDLA